MTALSSKRPKEVWRVIHRVLNPSTNPLRADPDQLNKHFISTNERTLGTTPDATFDLLELAKSFPEHSQSSFKLCHATFEDVMKEIRHLRSDCSTGVDQIPVKFVKLVSEPIAGPLTLSIPLLPLRRFLERGKLLGFYPSQRRITHRARKITAQYLFCRLFQKCLSG